MNEDVIRRAALAIGQAEALLVTAGAGMGVDSGLPDFRGDQGFWKAYPPFKELGLSFTDLANPAWFKHDPELAWGFYGHRRNLYKATSPHEGFHVLKEWAKKMPAGAFVFTSNVDGQFQSAGFNPNNIVECHGSISHLQCSKPCSDDLWSADSVNIEVDEATFRACPPLPECPYCGRVARPNVLMFGDAGWVGTRTTAQLEAVNGWLEKLGDGSLVVIECGAGNAIPTVRQTSEAVARQFEAPLIRINVREPEGPHGTLSISAGALEALKSIKQQKVEI
jgi:NAD-dependent SIR2 family protein deacetylase